MGKADIRRTPCITAHKLAAVAVGLVIGLYSDAAGAVPTANNLFDNLIASSAGINRLINLFSYVGGCGLVVAGIMKLKLHVDNPYANPMKDGMIRLFVAGALLSLPFMTSVSQGSISRGGADNAPVIARLNAASGTCFWYGGWVCN